MKENLSEILEVLQHDEKLTNVLPISWEGYRILLVKNIFQSFLDYPDLLSMRFYMQQEEQIINDKFKENNFSLKADFNYSAEYIKDLKLHFFLNEVLYNNFSNIEFKKLPEKLKAILLKEKQFNIVYKDSDNQYNNVFFEQVLSFLGSHYPAINYFLLNEKITKKQECTTTKNKNKI